MWVKDKSYKHESLEICNFVVDFVFITGEKETTIYENNLGLKIENAGFKVVWQYWN